MKTKVKRLFWNEDDFVRELEKAITQSGVHVRRNHHWQILEKGIFIDLAVPGSSFLDPILFAIECKAYKGQQAIQNAFGKCMMAHRIVPGRISVCLCLPSDDRIWELLDLGLRDICDAYQIALLNEKNVIEHIHNTKLTEAFNSLPKPPSPQVSKWEWAGLLKSAFDASPPVQRPVEVLVTDPKQVRKAKREAELVARREANETWKKLWADAKQRNKGNAAAR
jgi:hypothetical protein